MRVMFIGNSYTYYNDLPRLFQKLCDENGKAVAVFSQSRPDRDLSANLKDEDECTRAIEKLLTLFPADVCFLQGYSTLPITDFEAFRAGVLGSMERFADRVDRFVLYVTWSRKVGEPFLAEQNLTVEEMTKALSEAYQSVAAEANCDLSHVGWDFYDIVCRCPEIELYDADLYHPSYEGSCLAAMRHYVTLFGELPAAKSLGLAPEVAGAFYACLSREKK